MTPDEAQSLLIGAYIALVFFMWIEWHSIGEAGSPKRTCKRHPGTSYCRCRGNLPPKR